MVTTMVLPRLLERHGRPVVRVAAVTTRNLIAIRHSGYWLVVVSGFFEPVLYLLSIGVGVGQLIGHFEVGGRTLSYAAFVAPAMLAASAMTGALAESTYNFFARMKWVHLYDAMLATPLRPYEIALGELGWALLRGSVYSVAFLALMVLLGLSTVGWAALALVASLLVGLAFGGAGMAISTLMRSWQDFDYMNAVVFGLFMFSGTFAPVTSYPWEVKLAVAGLPLYHAVELIRGLTTGTPHWSLLGHAAYLAIMAVLGLAVAGRRMAKLLCQ
jgi:lipooligosaccharide transport system permease protein